MISFGRVMGLVLAALFLIPTVAKPEVLATFTRSGVEDLIEPEDLYRISLYTRAFCVEPSRRFDPRLFNDVYLDSTDVGTLLSAGSADYPDFDRYMNIVRTHGCYVYICGVSTATTRVVCHGGLTQYVFGDSFDNLRGGNWRTIRTVSLRVDALEFDFSDPSKTVVRWTATVMLEDTARVPTERSTWGAIKSLYQE